MEEGPAEEMAFDPVKQARLMTHLQDQLPALEFAACAVGAICRLLVGVQHGADGDRHAVAGRSRQKCQDADQRENG